ncbi:MAG TPA: DUF3168 domain-containing protein [Thermoguttaceae bacterium]|jgi:hypothetical protein|nr:DUF3168 domain-containing protein [Thermoguttaceae bacterium]HPP53113.1 DUF3168 domain-containing protein [Thermoguttaceae bacterium]
MSLEKAIHQRWAADAKLQERLPAEYLFTGRVSRDQTPYATLWRLGSRTVWRTAAGDLLEEVQLALRLWHSEYEQLRAVVEQVRRLLDRSSFELEEGGRVTALRVDQQRYRQEPEGRWLAELEMTAQVYWPPED